ncbi:MAG: hypothetical protein ABSB40_08205 [Nitrososphaeria archaeon]
MNLLLGGDHRMGDRPMPIIQTTLEDFDEQRKRLKLTTGSGDLDSLIGGIEGGSFYLFYGEPEILDLLIHRLLVNCVMPAEKGGLDAKAVYFNNTDYYVGKTLIDPSRLGMLAKHVGIDPSLVFKNVEVAAAFNEERQWFVSKEVADLIREKKEIKLLAVHNITRFLVNSKKPKESKEVLKKVVGNLWRTASENHVAFVMTVDAIDTGKVLAPKPLGGIYMRQAASILVHFRKFCDGPISSYKVTLVKHPYKRTPESIVLYVSQAGSLDLMTGRNVSSFQQLYGEQMDRLKRFFQNDFLDLGHRSAFDVLLKGAWNMEQKALSNLKEFTLLDGLNLTASVDTRALIESVQNRFLTIDDETKRLAQDIESIRNRINVTTRDDEHG